LYSETEQKKEKNVHRQESPVDITRNAWNNCLYEKMRSCNLFGLNYKIISLPLCTFEGKED